MRPSTSKAAVQLLMAFELPESASQDDGSTFRASTMELWNAIHSLASFDIVLIDQQHRRIACVVNKLKLVSPHLWKPVYALLYGLITKVLYRPIFRQPSSAF